MSTQFQRILKTKDVVKKLLTEYPETRDNDRLLILKVWKEQYPNLANISFRDFSTMYLNKKFIDTESIRRSRQKTQEEYRELRGKNDDLRRLSEDEMTAFIKGIEI